MEKANRYKDPDLAYRYENDWLTRTFGWRPGHGEYLRLHSGGYSTQSRPVVQIHFNRIPFESLGE